MPSQCLSALFIDMCIRPGIRIYGRAGWPITENESNFQGMLTKINAARKNSVKKINRFFLPFSDETDNNL